MVLTIKEKQALDRLTEYRNILIKEPVKAIYANIPISKYKKLKSYLFKKEIRLRDWIEAQIDLIK
jgi:hypothetical protein